MKDMRVLLITESYPPVLGSAGRLFSELAESLKERGCRVTVLTEIPNRYMADEGYRRRMFARETNDGIEIIRLPSFLLLRKFLPLRYLEQFLKMVEFLVAGLFMKHSKGVIIYSPPLPLAVSGILLARFYRTKAIVNIQDLYPQTPMCLGLMKNRFIIKFSQKMEKWIYENADFITVHSQGNKDYIVNKGIAPEKIWVVANWVDLKKYTPGFKKNQFREKFNLNGKFIVSFAGIMGFAQDMNEIINAAKILCEYERIFFVLAGGGVGYNSLKENAEKESLKNVLFLKHLPEKEYIELLRASDVCLVSLHKNLRTPVVPAKLQSIMAMGRPVLCSVPSTSDARTILEEVNCGIWIEPGDAEKIVEAILSLFKSPALEEMGRRGRVYAESFFNRRKSIEMYEKILSLDES